MLTRQVRGYSAQMKLLIPHIIVVINIIFNSIFLSHVPSATLGVMIKKIFYITHEVNATKELTWQRLTLRNKKVK